MHFPKPSIVLAVYDEQNECKVDISVHTDNDCLLLVAAIDLLDAFLRDHPDHDSVKRRRVADARALLDSVNGMTLVNFERREAAS